MYMTEYDVLDLYEVGADSEEAAGRKGSVPFIQWVGLEGPRGETVRVKAVVDDGAMCGAMDSAVFEKVAARLSTLQPSGKVLRMANGAKVASQGVWRGTVVVGGEKRQGQFEVFPSGGAWQMLFGKPLLEEFGMLHDYRTDELILPSEKGEDRRIQNQHGFKQKAENIFLLHSESNTIANTDSSDLTAASDTSPDLDTVIAAACRTLTTTINRVRPRNEVTFKGIFAAFEKAPPRTSNPRATVDSVEDIGDPRLNSAPNIGADESLEDYPLAGIFAVDEGSPPERRIRHSVKSKPTKIGINIPDHRATMEEIPDEEDPRLPSIHAIKENECHRRFPIAGVFSIFDNSTRDSLNIKFPEPIVYKYHDLYSYKPKETFLWTVDDNPGVEVPDFGTAEDAALFCRATDPFNVARVKRIIELVEIGPDLDNAQRERVRKLIADNADTFAQSIMEVTPVKGAVHTLDIPPGKTFGKKINQRPLRAPERAYYYPRIDEMEKAKVIRKIRPEDVKCCSPTTLAQKAHDNQGITLLEMKHRLNDQCEAAGFPNKFPALPEREPQVEVGFAETEHRNLKYRVCQNYKELNSVTQVAPMPQGDIRMKQHALSGKRWISMFDFAAGFYAVEIAAESQPYTAFYVEGRGYYCYMKMPFGLTGAPSRFAQMTAEALGDLVGTLLELFVDDGGMAGDDFETKFQNLNTFFQRCRETGLSLSAQKTKLFMSEVVFAGDRVGKEGVRGDPAKLTAVVDWQRPRNIQNLGHFLGLCGYFRTLIKDYARLSKPLKDLENELGVTTAAGKQAYRSAAAAHSLVDCWTNDHERAFLDLKAALVSDPVLRAPVFDGRPFIVTSDGCKDGFGAVLSQRFDDVLPNGTKAVRVHPVAYASKRSSRSEERYKPYLLEFAALKFSLDKFDGIIYGSPVELETDCQALRDTLLNEKLNATHARWRDGVLAHHIVDVRHRPGALNGAADGLSRQFTGAEQTEHDGHRNSVNPDWEATTGLAHDVFLTTSEEAAQEGGWMCRYSGLDRVAGDGHEWSIGDYEVARAHPDEATLGENQTDILLAGLDEDSTKLRERFTEEPIFLQVIDALWDLDKGKTVREKRRARHRALGYWIEGGKLWRLGDGKSTRAKPRKECVSQAEAVELARSEHLSKGHWHRDLIKKQLMDRFCSPRLDKSIMTALLECGRCKAFGAAHTYSLFQPITRRHPMELVVADYLAVPKGKGGFIEISLFIDMYSQYVWGFKHRTHGTAKTTLAGLEHLDREFWPPEAFMTDGGRHFDNQEVRAWCTERGIKMQIVAAYSAWVNGLVEGTNSKLLGRLKRRCAPDLGEDGWAKITSFEDLPASWPDHFEAALKDLNDRILPALEFTPRELLTGHVVNTITTPEGDLTSEPTRDDVETQMEYTRQQQLDAYSHIVEHANEREAVFNKKIDESRVKKLITFKINDLVQVYMSDLDYTFKTERKLLPKWGQVRRVISRDVNAYELASLEGLVLKGRFSARRLRRFEARPGTSLDDQQKALEAAMILLRNAGTLSGEEAEDVPEEGVSEPGERAGVGDEELPDEDEDGLGDENGEEDVDQESPQGGVDEGTGDNGADERGDQNQEGTNGDWTIPGRLRVRKPRDRETR